MKDAEKLVDTLRIQAYWINNLADQLEAGKEITCEWCIDPELLSNLMKEARV